MKKRFHSSARAKSKERTLALEPLEIRQMFSRDDAFAGVGSLTFSFAPDGTAVGEHTSRIFDGMGSIATSNEWQKAIATAFQKWAVQANVNFGWVADNGAASGVYGPTRGDERFGDIRITGFDYSTDTFAEAVSELTRSVGTWAGDIFFNTSADWKNTTNLEAAALHEVGHVLGLEHSDNPASPMHTHGPSGALELIAEDIAKLRAIHGPRKPDPNEASNGNNSISRASNIKGGSDDGSVASGFDGSQVWIQFGDLTTNVDRDVYYIKTDSHYTGPVAVEVRSSGLSLAKLHATLTDEFGKVLTFGQIDGPFGGSIILELPKTSPQQKLYLQVEAGADPFWATGDYSITVATPQRFLADGEEIGEWTRSAHRWYYDSDHSKDGYSWHRLTNSQTQPDLDHELHTDDTSGSARQLSPALITTARTVFQFVGAISDQTDVDHLRVKSPSSFSGPMEMTVDVESLQAGGLIPEAEILSHNGSVLKTETRVRGYGQFQVVLLEATPNTEYLVRLKSTVASSEYRTGNFSLFVTYAAPTAPAEVTLSGTLSKSEPVVEREWFVARPQLFALSIEGVSSVATPDAQIWVSVFDEQKKFISGLVAPIGELRTSPGLLLDPGIYYLQVAYAQSSLSPIQVDFNVKIDRPSNPIGPLLGTTGVEPRFLCPGETTIYCYPGTTTPTPRTTALGNPPLVNLPTPSRTPATIPSDRWFWQNNFLPTNPTNAMDANGDQFITPLDALLIVNRLNIAGFGAYPPPPEQIGYLDTSADGFITPLDVLLVINYLNLQV